MQPTAAAYLFKVANDGAWRPAPSKREIALFDRSVLADRDQDVGRQDAANGAAAGVHRIVVPHAISRMTQELTIERMTIDGFAPQSTISQSFNLSIP